MSRSKVTCPHCQAKVTVEVGEVEECPKCGGEVRVHEVGKDVEDEALKRLLASVKIVERGAAPKPSKPAAKPPQKKRPWWKFWG